MHGHYLNCILVETTLCDIIFMHYVLKIIYQLYGEDKALNAYFESIIINLMLSHNTIVLSNFHEGFGGSEIGESAQYRQIIDCSPMGYVPKSKY